MGRELLDQEVDEGLHLGLPLLAGGVQGEEVEVDLGEVLQDRHERARADGLAERGVERIYVWFTDFAPVETVAEFGASVIGALRATAA